MFVFKKDRLKKTIVAEGKDKSVIKLLHPSSKMAIQTTYNNDGSIPNEYPILVFKEIDNQYVIYEEFPLTPTKNIIEVFQEAIAFFENNIFESLNEKPPVQAPPPSPPTDTYQQLPVVGDFVQIGSNFGQVLNINGSKVKVKPMTKDQVMKRLRQQRNAELEKSKKN